MDLAERVKLRRKELGLSQAELAELVGIAQQSIHKIEDGRTLKPRNILQLAKALKCDPGWLQGIEIESSVETKPHGQKIEMSVDSLNDIVFIDEPEFKLRRVPILSQVQAGAWSTVDMNDGSFDFEEQLTIANATERAFAMRVTGNSMTNPFGSPSIPAGSIVLVEPCSCPANGKIVVATLNDSPEATIKKLEIDGPQKFLVPLNPKYDPIPINGNCRIVGYVKQIIMNV
ncbi:TPA: LexA family protein [Vibrio vulnificus]